MAAALAFVGMAFVPSGGSTASPNIPRIASPNFPRARVAVVAALPSCASVATACVVPTCLGLWKNGYSVSYGYGGAMLAVGAMTLPHTTGLAALHSAAYIGYGLRLILFLLYRELSLPASVHQMTPRDGTIGQRLERLPVILSCAILYFCMAAPLRLTGAAAGFSNILGRAAIATMHAGFLLAAVGDTWKSAVKARDGAGQLVTTGPYSVLRHPNYTGETIAWTASFFAGVVAAASSGAGASRTGWIAASALGALGIGFVLAEATAGLEKKQKLTYGTGPVVYQPRRGRTPAAWVGSASLEMGAYDSWVARTWAGIQL